MARTCTTMSWPQHADHASTPSSSTISCVPVDSPVWWSSRDRRTATPRTSAPLRGREYVRHLVRIARELPEIRGEPPRLYVVTRNAQTVLAGDVANLEQAGLRGLLRVIGTEHPHLRATQIDVDEATDAEQLARATARRVRGRRDRLA